MKIFEKPVMWWKTRPVDAKNSLMPLLISFVSGSIMFYFAIYLDERNEEIKVKSTVSGENS